MSLCGDSPRALVLSHFPIEHSDHPLLLFPSILHTLLRRTGAERGGADAPASADAPLQRHDEGQGGEACPRHSGGAGPGLDRNRVGRQQVRLWRRSVDRHSFPSSFFFGGGWWGWVWFRGGCCLSCSPPLLMMQERDANCDSVRQRHGQVDLAGEPHRRLDCQGCG